MWGTWPWILLPIIWHGFQILFSTLQQKGRAMLTAPSPIPRFWQFFISWLCCTLIKCVFFPPWTLFPGFLALTQTLEPMSYAENHFVCQHCLGVVFSLPLLTAIYPWESPLCTAVVAIACSSCSSIDEQQRSAIPLSENISNTTLQRGSRWLEVWDLKLVDWYW